MRHTEYKRYAAYFNISSVWAVGDARPYCLVSLKTLHVKIILICHYGYTHKF